MAERTERRLTRDLMLEAVPYHIRQRAVIHNYELQRKFNLQILQPTSLPLVKLDLLGLRIHISNASSKKVDAESLTNDKRNHRGSISPSGLKALDKLLHLPYLDVLLSFVRLSRAHVGRGDGN